MQFIYPSFLWALALIALPVIIHLLNLRKHRTVYFSNVNLLKKVKQESLRKSKIKQLFIMTSRILMLMALVFAFSKPYWPGNNEHKNTGKHTVGIYIDNSFSMNAEGPEGIALESARQKAWEVIRSSEPDTRFAIVTNELSEQQNRIYTQSEAIRIVGEVEETYHWIPFSTIALRLSNLMDKLLLDTRKSSYFISDFQRHTIDFSALQPDTSMVYNFVPIPVNAVPNLYIDTCWFDAPTHHFNQLEVLNVRIVNHSQSDYPQVPVNFYLNDSIKALAAEELKAGEQKVITLQYTNTNLGFQQGRIEISDYPIVYDNTIYLAYHVKNELKTLLIETNNQGTTRNFQAMFLNDPYIRLDIERADRLQISALPDYSTIILNEMKHLSSGLIEELIKYVRNGGTLVVIPPSNADAITYNQLFSPLNIPLLGEYDTIAIPIAAIAYRDELFEEVFKDEAQQVELPLIGNRYRLEGSQQMAVQNILSFADQSTAIGLNKIGNGKVYQLAFTLSDSENEFLKHLLFLPTFYNIVLQSASLQQLYHILGVNQSVDVQLPENARTQNLLLRHIQSKKELVPTITKLEGNLIRIASSDNFEAGIYELFLDEDMVSTLAFNYQLRESDLKYYTGEELMLLAKQAGIQRANLIEGKSQTLRETIEALDKGKQLWKWFLALALLFIALEAAIIRFWK